MTTHTEDLDETEHRVRKGIGHYAGRVARGAGRGLQSAYRSSNVGKDLSKLGGSLLDTIVGLPIRAARGIVNFANYTARAVVGAPEAGARKLYEKVEGLEHSLDDRVRAAKRHHETTITVGPNELETIRYFGADAAIHHLEGRLKQAEEEQRTLRIPVSDVPRLIDYLKKTKKTDALEPYRAAAAVISFVVALLSFDQVRLTGFAVSGATGGYDYYSLFGFLFLALAILLLCMHRRR